MTRRIPRILCVAGARPNFMKVAPILGTIAQARRQEASSCITGQHYDASMSDRLLRIWDSVNRTSTSASAPRPRSARRPGSWTARAAVAEALDPACVLVVGDVNSTWPVPSPRARCSSARPRRGGLAQPRPHDA